MIKPCPFCGRTFEGEKNITMRLEAKPFECSRCGAKGPLVNHIKAAVTGKPQKYYDAITTEAWNRRAK